MALLANWLGRRKATPYAPGDFFPDPWEAPEEPTPEGRRAALRAKLAGFAAAFAPPPGSREEPTP